MSTFAIASIDAGHRDLAPGVVRQRLVIEGHPPQSIVARAINKYLSTLSSVLQMTTVLPPVTHRSERFGGAGWIHWETSGAHFYTWDRPLLFFSVDIYTCKPFSVEEAVQFTREYFDCDTLSHRTF